MGAVSLCSSYTVPLFESYLEYWEKKRKLGFRRFRNLDQIYIKSIKWGNYLWLKTMKGGMSPTSPLYPSQADPAEQNILAVPCPGLSAFSFVLSSQLLPCILHVPSEKGMDGYPT